MGGLQQCMRNASRAIPIICLIKKRMLATVIIQDLELIDSSGRSFDVLQNYQIIIVIIIWWLLRCHVNKPRYPNLSPLSQALPLYFNDVASSTLNLLRLFSMFK
jgi:hypothetical protein